MKFHLLIQQILARCLSLTRLFNENDSLHAVELWWSISITYIQYYISTRCWGYNLNHSSRSKIRYAGIKQKYQNQRILYEAELVILRILFKWFHVCVMPVTYVYDWQHNKKHSLVVSDGIYESFM